MVTHLHIDDRPACPRNCTTYQQYGDCGHQRPSEVVDLKREIAALRALALRLGEELERDLQIIHGYRCAPAPECDGYKETCMWPRYAVLETDPRYRAVKEGK